MENLNDEQKIEKLSEILEMPIEERSKLDLEARALIEQLVQGPLKEYDKDWGKIARKGICNPDYVYKPKKSLAIS